MNTWLAGLIEGDGSIIVHKKTHKKRYPFIRIAFHKKDKPVAKYLIKKLGYGLINDVGKNTCIWTVNKKDELLDLTMRINGNMRTPKHTRLHELILYYDWNVPLLGINQSDLNKDSWLSGMSDADSNFNVIVSQRKKYKTIRVQRHWRLEFAQKTYFGESQEQWALLLSHYLSTNLYTRVRTKLVEDNVKYYHSYMVMAYNKDSIQKIKAYFDEHPLLSSKYLDFKDWVKIGELNPKEDLKAIKLLKSQMNNQRVYFNWDHLNL